VSGLATTDHVVPSKVSTSVWLTLDPFQKAPTAVHELIETHDTPKRSLIGSEAVLGSGLGATDQVVPSHISTRVRGCVETEPLATAVPAATQKLVETHDTPLRRLPLVPGLGLGATDQVAPSHISTRVPLPVSPTATQKCFETQDTPLRKSNTSGLGLGTTDQVVPSHMTTTVVNGDIW
jgi:hypothetical protein